MINYLYHIKQILSYYINLQIDTIDLKTSYDTKLLDATHDTMRAFEINTANEDLSSDARGSSQVQHA